VLIDAAKADGLPFPQALEGVTVIFPGITPTVTATVFEPPPDIITHPAGKLHE
jgi:hypothetical protein